MYIYIQPTFDIDINTGFSEQVHSINEIMCL